MAVSYKKLWKLLIDQELKKKDLEALAGVSHYTISKLTRSENVTTDVLARICNALGCNIGEIMDVLPDAEQDGFRFAEQVEG